MNSFREIQAEKIPGNIFDRIGNQWMLVTAGDQTKFNTMTASWGGVGVLWSRPVAFCFIRPQRYTYEFIEKQDGFTLSFFDGGQKEALNLCGSRSGREVDKAKAAGLTPVHDGSRVWFEEASLVLVCKKLYFHDFDPAHFLDSSIMGNYAKKDFHRMYVGGIEKVLQKA